MLWFFISLAAIGALVALTIALVIPSLPSLESLTEYRPKLPLRVYSSDGFLMAEFGEERRAFIKIQNVPKKINKLPPPPPDVICQLSRPSLSLCMCPDPV